jgi:transketolase
MMQNQELEKENQYVLLHTEMGNGVDFMMYSHAWHGKAPNDTQLEIALGQTIQKPKDY